MYYFRTKLSFSWGNGNLVGFCVAGGGVVGGGLLASSCLGNLVG